MKNLKFTNQILLMLGLLFICCNNSVKEEEKDTAKKEVVEFISFKKIEYSNIDSTHVLHEEPKEIDCTVTIIWDKSKKQFHIYDDGKGIIDYEVAESSENENEIYLEAKQKMRNEDFSDEDKAAFEPFTDYLKMKINRKDSVALLQISNKYYGTVYYMQLD